jgi:hypothetical protein
VEFVDLDEIGSNFDREVYDPYGFPPEAFADQLGKFMRIILFFNLFLIDQNMILFIFISKRKFKRESRRNVQ